MRTRHFLVFLWLSLVFTSSAYSQQQNKPNVIDATLKSCLDKKENQTTAGMCNCTYEALKEWDTKLNTTYKSLLTKLDPAAKTSLITAQRQWVLFKEKEIALIGATYGKAQGTIWQPVRASQVMELTKQRALQLDSLLEMLEEL